MHNVSSIDFGIFHRLQLKSSFWRSVDVTKEGLDVFFWLFRCELANMKPYLTCPFCVLWSFLFLTNSTSTGHDSRLWASLWNPPTPGALLWGTVCLTWPLTKGTCLCVGSFSSKRTTALWHWCDMCCIPRNGLTCALGSSWGFFSRTCNWSCLLTISCCFLALKEQIKNVPRQRSQGLQTARCRVMSFDWSCGKNKLIWELLCWSII